MAFSARMTPSPGFGRIALALAAALLLPLGAQAQQLVPAQSQVGFTIQQMGVPVQGQFKRFSAQIRLDPKAPQSGSVSFAIDTGSAGFGTAELDAELPKPIWLNVAKFPQATFQSSEIKAAGAGRYEVTGNLTIKGQSQRITVPVALSQAGGQTTATGGFTIQRLAFRIGEGEWSDTSLLINDVKVNFKLAISGMGAI